jgi:hypothetical protein
MKLHALKFGIASAITISIVWTICALMVLIFPASMMSMSGEMMHLDSAGVGWSLSFIGYVIGLICWAVFSGLSAWFFALVYNRLI